MFVRNCWYVAAWDYQVTDDGIFAISILNEPIAIYRRQSGQVAAIADRCAHRFAPLSLGRKEGDSIRCMYHGLKFNHRGECVEIPGGESVSTRIKVRDYPVLEAHSWIWVWMGDAALADPALIPDVKGIHHSDWSMKPGQMDYDVNYLWIADNLLDFSHLAYVHATSFGVSEEWASYPATVRSIERGVHVQRFLKDQPVPQPPLPSLEKVDKTDIWNAYDFVLPGILIMEEATYPAGTAARFASEKPDASVEPYAANYTCQALTPMTENTTRYFFAWGPRAIEDVGGLADVFANVAVKAFTEDHVLIHAQQRNIKLNPGERPFWIKADKALGQFRKLVEQLAGKELGKGISQTESRG